MAKARSVQWKRVERDVAQLFGGMRVPLSGSNSGHGTTSDVRNIPTTMYIEVKRDARYNPFFLKYYDALKRGIVLRARWEAMFLWIFRVDTFMTQETQTLSPDVDIQVRSNAKPLNLFVTTWKKAQKENKDVVLLVHRIHGKEGLYCVTDQHSAKKLIEWTDIFGKPMLKRKRSEGRLSSSGRKATFPAQIALKPDSPPELPESIGS